MEDLTALRPIVVRENGVNTVRGILRDRLGSLVTMLESGGNFVTYRSYDAFGKTRGGNFDDRPNGTFNFLPHSLHGFTDHNHVDDVWLLHMNGRVYDYQLGRFLSPDPLVQFPANSQSLNPYSYILNNPLAGRDPSGYAVDVAGGECTKMTGSNICGQDTGAQNGQTSQTYHFSDDRGGQATVTQTRGSNGAVMSQSVTGYGGIKDQAAPGSDKGAGKGKEINTVGSGGVGLAGFVNPAAEAFLKTEAQKAGSLFCLEKCQSSPTAAHEIAANRYLGASIGARREVAYRVYKLKDQTFSFTYPNISAANSHYAALPDLLHIDGVKFDSGGHTHWDWNNQFSPQDWRVITQERRHGSGITLYVATRNGKLQFSTPQHARAFGIIRGTAFLPPYGNFSGVTVPDVQIRTTFP